LGLAQNVGRKRTGCVHFFALNLGKNGLETLTILKDAFGDECWSRVCTFKWFKWFKEGRTSDDDGPQSRLPSTAVEGIVHREYVPEGKTANQHYCVEVLKGLRHAVYCKRQNKQKSHAWAVHHDNTPTHTVHSFQVFLSKSWHFCGSATTLFS
jgi:hypothetical protein